MATAIVLAWRWLERADSGGPAPAPAQAQVVADSSAEENPIDGEAAYAMLLRICALGSRMSGSPGMEKQQEILTSHFEELGGQVSRKSFDHRHPETGERVVLTNLIVQWHPDRKERILLCCHYDTRPYADLDPQPALRQSPMPGANDAGSGVAVLSELGRHMPGLDSPLGVDFVFFDAEEFVFVERRDPYFLGSTHFARDYRTNPPDFKYKGAVLLDMVGDAHLEIAPDRFSMAWRDSRWLIDGIWGTAERLGVREFVRRRGPLVRDDHLPLHDIARIPACNLIDFDYPRPGARSYWHTTHDTPDKCSPNSLAKVGWVVLEWLRSL